jgi:peptide/nickel transport system ATP-binding protein
VSEPILAVHSLSVRLSGEREIVQDIDLELNAGEALGIVGESGSGKTTLGLSLLGFARPGARITGGSILVGGQELVGRPEHELRLLRGRLVCYVPQEPGVALVPSLRVGAQVAEMLRIHESRASVDERVEEVLRRVELPTDRDFLRRYPHQLSGGQQQRLAIAVALTCRPPLVVLDEPTTGLDVVTQSYLLAEIARLRRELGMAIVYVTHDLAVVSSVADRVAVMYAGRIVEQARTEELLERPRHPYTVGLIASVPDHLTARRLRGIPGIALGVGHRPAGCAFAPRCSQRVPACESAMPPLDEVRPGHLVRCPRWQQTPLVSFELRPESGPAYEQSVLSVESLHALHRVRGGEVIAAAGVSFAIQRRECLALVGESGSGKTTIARCLVGIHEPAAGAVKLDGVPLAPLARQRPKAARRRLQIVFQNPYDSLNPRQRIHDAIAGPAEFLRRIAGREARAEALQLLERVRLPSALANRYPAELSGGERQRVAIARALAPGPDVLICDEITSALDVSVQAAVLDLLAELQRELGLALLFITHNLGVVASIADRVAVLERGRICEEGPAQSLLQTPEHAYTRRLIDAAPTLSVFDLAS